MKNSSGEVIVDFCFRRAGRIILAVSALVLVPSFVAVPSAKAQGTAAAGQKNWKDREEYDAFQKVQQATDPEGPVGSAEGLGRQVPDFGLRRHAEPILFGYVFQIGGNRPEHAPAAA